MYKGRWPCIDISHNMSSDEEQGQTNSRILKTLGMYRDFSQHTHHAEGREEVKDATHPGHGGVTQMLLSNKHK